MSKEDRYSHLGDQSDGEEDTAAATAPETASEGVVVTVADGDDEVTIQIEDEEVTTDDVLAAIQAETSDGATRHPPWIHGIRASGRLSRAMFHAGTVGIRSTSQLLRPRSENSNR